MGRRVVVLGAVLFVACGEGTTPFTSSGRALATGDTPSGGAPVVADPSPGPGTVITEPADDAAYLFDQSQLYGFYLEIAPGDLATIDADPAAEQYVPATFRFEAQELAVGVRYKGSVGAFVAPCLAADGSKDGKCSMKVSFNWQDDAGRFYGLKKLNFHSLNGDPSLMRDRLGYAMFRESGVPAPRATHARLFVNGELEGLFALVEQVDGRFTRSRFTEGGKGNLYKEVWPYHDDASAYLNALETNEDENPSVQRMLDFKDAIAEGASEMEAWIDRRMMLDFLAVDRVIINDDGIFHWWCLEGGQGRNPGPFGNHNYYWYEAVGADRFWLIAWDLDHSFNDAALLRVQPEWREPGACSCILALQRAPSCDPLIALWASEWSDDYEAAVDRFLSGPYAAANVAAKLDTWETQIADAVAEAEGVNESVSVLAWQRAMSMLRDVIARSRENRGYAY